MTTDYKVTELFCIIDEFCKHFDAENAGNLLEDNSGVKRRRRQASLSDSEIMTILLYFHFGTFRNFKHYYLFFIKGTMKSYFPKAVSYNRFVELESRVFFQLMSRELPLTEKEQWVGAMAYSTLRVMTEAR